MKLFGLQIGREPETRSLENPRVPISDSKALLAMFGVSAGNLPTVTEESALTVPAWSAGTNFLSRSLANLPLHAFRTVEDQPQRLPGKLQRILNEAPNPEWSSFGFRQYFWSQVFASSAGRGLAWIERIGPNVDAIWPMDATQTTVKRVGGKKVYTYGGKDYPAADVIDVPFMLKADQLGTNAPLAMAAKALALALAMGEYAGGFFAGGGVPPLALVGPLPAGAEAMKRAQADVKRAIDGAKSRNEPIMPVPAGYELRPVGFDPEKGQMTDAMLFQVQEIGRVLGLPPVFVGDLSRGTYSNTEQQDLQLVKHLIAHWAKALEDELNLKIFGAQNNRRYVEHSLDGLLRGDFKSRMEALAQGIQNAVLMPDEARALENRPPAEGGNKLYIQGATVPLGSQPKDGATPPATDGGAQ